MYASKLYGGTGGRGRRGRGNDVPVVGVTRDGDDPLSFFGHGWNFEIRILNYFNTHFLKLKWSLSHNETKNYLLC